MRRSMLVTVGAAAVLGLLVAGCGSSGGGSAGTGAAPGGAAIRIGALGSYTGPQAPSLGAMDDTIKAWASYTNARGGINGHPVQLTVYDDQNDPTKARTFAQKLIEQDHVVAIVGSASLVTDGWAKVAQDAGVPVIGSIDFQPEYATNPDFFATGGQIPALVYGALKAAKTTGVTKVGVLPCAEASACTQFAGLFTAIGKIVGLPVVFNQKITVSQPSYQAVCLAARDNGVDGLATLENDTTVVKVANHCAQQGYRPIQINVAATAGSAWVGETNLEGAVSAHSDAVPSADQVPEIKIMNAALDQYAPGVRTGAQYNVLDSSAWAGGQLFKLAAENAKLTPTSTPADVITGLYQLKDETLNGLTPPLTYAQGKAAFVTCWFTQQIKNGKFTALDNGTTQCIPASDMPAVLQALAG